MKRWLILLLLAVGGCTLMKVAPAPPGAPADVAPMLTDPDFNWLKAGQIVLYAAAGLMSLAAGSREARKRLSKCAKNGDT